MVLPWVFLVGCPYANPDYDAAMTMTTSSSPTSGSTTTAGPPTTQTSDTTTSPGTSGTDSQTDSTSEPETLTDATTTGEPVTTTLTLTDSDTTTDSTDSGGLTCHSVDLLLPNLMFVIDHSATMAEQTNDGARRYLRDTVVQELGNVYAGSLNKDVKAGVIVYPRIGGTQCSDAILDVGLQTQWKGAYNVAVDDAPAGAAPLSSALTLAYEELMVGFLPRNAVILITDGVPNCESDNTELADTGVLDQIQTAAFIGIRTFSVGISTNQMFVDDALEPTDLLPEELLPQMTLAGHTPVGNQEGYYLVDDLASATEVAVDLGRRIMCQMIPPMLDFSEIADQVVVKLDGEEYKLDNCVTIKEINSRVEVSLCEEACDDVLDGVDIVEVCI